MPRRAADAYIAAEEQRPLLHAEQAERFLRVQVAILDADTVVAYLERRLLLAEGKLDVDARGARVPRHVGQDLLEDAEHRGRDVDVELRGFGGQLRPAADAGALLELLRLPADRGD